MTNHSNMTSEIVPDWDWTAFEPHPIPFVPILNNFPAIFELNGNLLVAIWRGEFCPFQSAMNVGESTSDAKTIII
jgi:hypothetical protein